MTSRNPRYNSRAKPTLDFSSSRQAGQTTLDDDVEDFASLRSGTQRTPIKQDRKIEIVDDDEIKEVKPTRTNVFAGTYSFVDDVDELVRPPLRRRLARKTRKNVFEIFQNENSSDDEGLSSVTKREQEDIKRAIMLSRQEAEKEKKEQFLLFEKFSSSKQGTAVTHSRNKKKGTVVIMSTDDEDLREPATKHRKTTENRQGAESPELFPSQTIECDQDDDEIEDSESSPTVPCGAASSCKQYSSTSVGNSPSRITTSTHSESTTDKTMHMIDINVETATQGTDSEPWLTASKAEKRKLKLNKKQESQVQQQQKPPVSKKMPTSSEETLQEDCNTTGIKRKAVKIKVEPPDDPPHKKRYVTVENLWSRKQTTVEPVILVLDDDDDDNVETDKRINERTKLKSNTTYRRKPQIIFERCYKKIPPLPRTAKEAYKAGLHFAPPGVCSREYSPYIMKLFKKYSTKLRRVQSRVLTRIPWGNAVVCGPRETNSLDYKAPLITTNGNRAGTSGLSLELTHEVGMPVKPSNSRKRSLRSHTRSKNSPSVARRLVVESDSEEELRSYLVEKPCTDAQNTWKNLLKDAETSAVFEASTIVQPSKTENTCSDQRKVTSKLDTDTGVETKEAKENTETIASSEIPLCSDTEEYDTNSLNFENVAKKNMDITKSDSGEAFSGESSKEVNVLETSENKKENLGGSSGVCPSSDCSPVCQPKRQKSKRKNLESSSDEDADTDLPTFSLQVPTTPIQKQHEEEENPSLKMKHGSKIEIKISPLNTDIHTHSRVIPSSSTKPKACSADSTTDSHLTAKQSSSVMLPQGKETPTKDSEQPVPTFQKSATKSGDRSPRSEKSAKLAAAAEARMRKQNLQVQDTSSNYVKSSAMVDLTENLNLNADQQAANDNLATKHVTERECPLCYKKFSESEIEIHAANCNGLPTEELQSNKTETTIRNLSQQSLLNSPIRQKLPEMKVVLRRSPVADRKAREKHFQTNDSKTLLDFNSVKTETSKLSPRRRTVSVSSDDDSTASGITSSRQLRPRRAIPLDYSDPETEERNGTQPSANSQSHSKSNTRCRDI